MHRDAFSLQTAVSGGDSLTALKGFFPVGPMVCDLGRRDQKAVQDSDMKNYIEWRMERLLELFGDEIDHQDTQDQLRGEFRQMERWVYLSRTT
jgi:hypothetical protein